MWLRRRPFLEGAESQVRVSTGWRVEIWRIEKGQMVTRGLRLARQKRGGKDKQTSVLGCGSTG